MFKFDEQASAYQIMPAAHQLETLEPRVLLTTLMGGEVFEYIDARGQTVRVTLEGDIIAELIGGDIDNTSNELILGDLPGYIYSSTLGREGAVNGGLGGADGTELLGQIKITDPLNGSPGSLTGPADLLNIQALGTHPSTGNTWAMNFITLTPQGQAEQIKIVQLIEFDHGTGIGTVRHAFQVPGTIVNGTETNAVEGIVAAAFDIRAGRENYLYFVTRLSSNGGYELMAVNVNTGNLVTDNGVPRKRILVTAADAARSAAVSAITFDRVGNNYMLVVATTRPGSGANAVAQGYIERSVGSDDFFGVAATVNSVRVTFKGDPVPNITGISILTDNTSQAEQYVYATIAGGRLYRIDLNTGRSQDLGNTIDPDDGRENKRGAALQDLTWNATLLNPFTGEMGVLVAVDTATDDLVYLDHRPRFSEADIFAIYIAQASENARISISIVDPITKEGPRSARPYGPETIGSIRLPGDKDPITSAPVGSGGVLIGALTEALTNENSAYYIIWEGMLGSEGLGLRPANYSDLGDIAGQISSGIVVAPNMLKYVQDAATTWNERLMGGNLDIIRGLAVSRFGKIMVVDTDQSNIMGEASDGDEIARLDPATGQLIDTDVYTIFDSITLDSLTGTRALAYGFADLTQVNSEADEELYAIIGNRFGRLGETGMFTAVPGDLSTIGDLDANAIIYGMAFGTGGSNGKQDLYIVADPDGTDIYDHTNIYKVSYNLDGSGRISAITDITRLNVDDIDVRLSDLTFDSDGNMLALDRTNARLVQINPTTGAITPLSQSPLGSVRNSVVAISYDWVNDRILVVDNVTGQSVLRDEAHDRSPESAALMVLNYESSRQNMGSILVGGTVLGRVTTSGSLDTFYAGWLMTAAPEFGNEPVGNFYVDGDLRNLVVGTHIGTETDYDLSTYETINFVTQTHIEVAGRLGEIYTSGSGLFKLTVHNTDSTVYMTSGTKNQREYEHRREQNVEVDVQGEAFHEGLLYFGERFFNDTLESAQFLGTITTGVAGEADIIRVEGTLGQKGSSTDNVDYYAVALLAGQVITLRLTSDSDPYIPIGVYDPDGRLIVSESDPISIDPLTMGQVVREITFTVQSSGIYTFGVGGFNPMVQASYEGEWVYTLEVEGVGNVGVGGLKVKGDYFYVQGTDAAIEVVGGDMGGMRVDGTVRFDGLESLYLEPDPNFDPYTSYWTPDIITWTGNLRAVTAGAVGLTAGSFSGGINALVYGHLGNITALNGVLAIGETFVTGDVHYISGVAEVFMRLYVNGGVGNIHAGSLPTNMADVSVLHVNFDNIGRDGIIDLIDVAGDLGSVLYGGMRIITGPGGNVRYIRVGGNVYQDAIFAGGDAGFISAPNVSVIDDSGARVNLSATAGGNLEVLTYGIRGSGGSVIVRVTTTTGLNASSSTSNNNQPAEISEIVVNGQGQGVIIDPVRGTVVTDRTDPLVGPVSVTITGSSPLDVFSIVGSRINNISNNTTGELVNINAASVVMIYAAGSIGLAKSSHGQAVLSRTMIFDTFPFSRQRNAVAVGDVGTVRSDRAIGNIIADSSFGGGGMIGTVQANYDKRDVAGVFEGINGPVYASGNIYSVNIGEGVASSGTGYHADAGIFAEGFIGTITNQGLGSDIRGTISSTLGIDKITLTGGGSIIDTTIMVATSLDFTSYQAGNSISIFETSYINSISLSGNGGIIGSMIAADRIGNITVKNGFGIINTYLSTLAGGSIGNIYADGFGLRGVHIGSGVTTGNITAGQRSNGDLSIGAYTASVRASEFDPDNATMYNDLFTALSIHELWGHFTSASLHSRSFQALDDQYTYKAGVIYGIMAHGTLDLGAVKAYRIESAEFNYANSVNGLKADESIIRTDLITGRINEIATGSSKSQGNIGASTFVVSGNISSINVYGDIYDTDILTNNNGALGKMNVNKLKGTGQGGNLYGSEITVAGRINTIKVDGDIDGTTIVVLSGTSGAYAINSLTLGGNLVDSFLDFQDDVNTIKVAGSFGSVGDQLVIKGSLKSLSVGTDRKINDVIMGLDLFVLGDLGTVNVRGNVLGDITVQGSLKSLTITPDAMINSNDISGALEGDVTVTESIGSITVRNGNVTGNITAGRDLTKFTITNGSFHSTASARSVFGAIKTFTVTGDMNGLLSVDQGDITTLRIGGDMGSNASVYADNVKTITITGQLQGGAGLYVKEVINTLTAGYIGDVDTMVNIVAGGVNTLTAKGIRNVNNGDIYANLDLGPTDKVTRINAAGNLGGSAIIRGDLAVTVRGDVDMDTTEGQGITVVGNVTTFSVTGNLSGGLYVKGTVSSLTAGSVSDAIFTSGFDVKTINIKGEVTNSVFQVGIWAGEDLIFTSIDGQQDLGEVNRKAALKTFKAANVSNTIIAAGGDIGTVTIGQNLEESSVSSGYSIGSLAIAMAQAGNQHGLTLRAQDGRELLAGSITTLNTKVISNSFVTAGVGAGSEGDFSDAVVFNPNNGRLVADGGGISTIGRISGVTNDASRIIADSGIARNSTTGDATVIENLSYTLDQLQGDNALPGSRGIATQAQPFVYTSNGIVVTITVKGPGQVDVRDIDLTDNVIDGLLISGTTKTTTIDIKTSAPGEVHIGRVLSEDDASLRSFTFDGKIVGDGTNNVDFWIDGDVTTLTLGGFGSESDTDRATGVLGGNITTFNLGSQDQGVLRAGGSIGTLNIISGSADPLQYRLDRYDGQAFTGLTIDDGNVWAYENGRIYTLDPLNGGGIVEHHQVRDAALGTGLTILGMDVAPGTSNIYAVAQVYNQNPTVLVGALTSELHGIAVRQSDGAIFAIHHDTNTSVDQLVRINPANGVITVVGNLIDIFGKTYGSNAGSQVMGLAFNGNTLLAILTDREGANGGAPSGALDISLAAISTTANNQGNVRVTSSTGNQSLPPVLLSTNTGEEYSGMVVHTYFDDVLQDNVTSIFAVRNGSEIVEINFTTGQDVGAAQNFAGLWIRGIGFDDDGNLIGLDGISGHLYKLDLDTGDATALAGVELPSGLTQFTISTINDGNGRKVYAYDGEGLGRALYTNPGMGATLGVLNPTTGEFTQLLPLATDTQGTPLADTVINVLYDNANNRIKVLTDKGVIYTYNTDGSLDENVAPLTLVPLKGQNIRITMLDYHADGRLIGINDLGKQIVIIDEVTGEVSNLTEAGSVRGSITAFAIDSTTGQAMLFNNRSDEVTSLQSYTQRGMGGLTATSINKATLGPGYGSRLEATNTLGSLTINGDFSGSVVTGSTLKSMTVNQSDFSGSVYTAGDLTKATFKNTTLDEHSLLWADNKLSVTFNKSNTYDNTVQGTIVAGHIVNLTSNGVENSTANIVAGRKADTIKLGGDFAGTMDLASVTKSLSVGGVLADNAQIIVHGDAKSITLSKGAQAGTLLAVEGSVGTLTVGGTFSGVIGIRDGLQTGSFAHMDRGLITVGLDTRTFKTSGNAVDSVISFGTWFGDDFTYNTADDLITGGIVKSVTIGGHYRNTVTAAGVLPSFRLGGFIPGQSSNYAFLGNSNAGDPRDLDPAEAGGLLRTSIDSFTVRGEIVSTSVPNGRVATLVAADNIGKVNTGQTGNILRQRVYTDPFGAPYMLSTSLLNFRSFEIIMSEELNTATLAIFRDLDNDYNFSIGDVMGSIIIERIIVEGNDVFFEIINDATLTYSTRLVNNEMRSVITVTTVEPIVNGWYLVTMMPLVEDQDVMEIAPTITDRSGLRSAMMLIGDPFGSIVVQDTLFPNNVEEPPLP